MRSDALHHSSSAEEHAAMMSHLDQVLADLASSEMKKDPMEQLMNSFKGPQTLLERLYIDAFSQSMVKEGKVTVNLLKLAQELLKYR